jgi:hypothetical protein
MQNNNKSEIKKLAYDLDLYFGPSKIFAKCFKYVLMKSAAYITPSKDGKPS